MRGITGKVVAALFAAVAVAAIGYAVFALARAPREEPGTTGRPGSSSSAEQSPSVPATPPSGEASVTPPHGGPSGDGATASPKPTAPPLEPAADGAALEQITQPPAETVWAFVLGTYTEGARIELRFRPYGIGPGSLGESVAVAVVSAKPVSADQKTPALTGKNAVIVLGASKVEVGGTYSGIGVVTTRGDRSVIVLESAKRSE